MRLYDLKVEHINSNFKDTQYKIESVKPKPEIQYNSYISFQNMLDIETKKLEDC